MLLESRRISAAGYGVIEENAILRAMLEGMFYLERNAAV